MLQLFAQLACEYQQGITLLVVEPEPCGSRSGKALAGYVPDRKVCQRSAVNAYMAIGIKEYIFLTFRHPLLYQFVT